MPHKILPVYQIRDFDPPGFASSGFYLNRFEKHVSAHAFVQHPHKHDFYIVLFFTTGTGTHTIDFKTYPVNPGFVFFLSPGQVHSWVLSPETSGYVLCFTAEFFLSGKAAQGMYRFPFYNTLDQNSCLPLSDNEASTLTGLMLEIEAEYLQKSWKKEDVLRNYLENMLIRFARNYMDQQPVNPETQVRLSVMQQLDELVDNHFKGHKPVSFYADQLNITTKQLNELVNQALNKTPSEVIQSRIILEAKRLLTHSGLTITQVAAELGFFDNSYFSRFFKKNSGQTPEQFRQSLK